MSRLCIHHFIWCLWQLFISPFYKWETEAQKCDRTCQRSQIYWVVELWVATMFQVQCLNHPVMFLLLVLFWVIGGGVGLVGIHFHKAKWLTEFTGSFAAHATSFETRQLHRCAAVSSGYWYWLDVCDLETCVLSWDHDCVPPFENLNDIAAYIVAGSSEGSVNWDSAEQGVTPGFWGSSHLP